MDFNFSQFEVNLRNYYFVLTFVTTIYYWVKIIFLSKSQSIKLGYAGIIILNLTLTLQLILRWINSGHFPLSGLYESLLFLTWGVSFIYLFIEKFIESEFIGLIISPFLLCLITFTEFSLPSDLQTTQPLVPALQSNWLFMHVSVMILSYAGLLIGSLISIIYLVLNTNKITTNQITNSLILIDNLSYRTIGIGFCFLTLGILSGAVWANETWGTYWSWDPKETWALITWLMFAIYLHTRLLYGWTGQKSAILGSCGFVLIWICYLGVNLLGKGLHTYGFLST
jgi:cytochrome c-type biogenesis protein CcsB